MVRKYQFTEGDVPQLLLYKREIFLLLLKKAMIRIMTENQSFVLVYQLIGIPVFL